MGGDDIAERQNGVEYLSLVSNQLLFFCTCKEAVFQVAGWSQQSLNVNFGKEGSCLFVIRSRKQKGWARHLKQSFRRESRYLSEESQLLKI